MCTLGVSFLTPLIGENALEAWSIFNFFFSNKNVFVCEQWSWDHFAFRSVVCLFLQVNAGSSVPWDICAVIAASLQWGRPQESSLSDQERDQSGKGAPRFIFIVNLSFAFTLLLVSTSNNSRMAGIDKV